ncbi:hypothetical protein ACJJIE_03690 [Microbulbifer sp. TRSA001]|uniref:hypothetical protein n=1 Tax=Microbulbifer sp. TRSA001 TaxID=3243381 RepID=UPI004039B631
MVYQVISDEYIEELFEGTNFGEKINNSTQAKRGIIAKCLKNQIEGFWSGHTMYHILINGGFLINAKTSETKRLTALGRAFLETHGNS